MEDKHDAVKFALLTHKVEIVLKSANEDVLNYETTRTIIGPSRGP